MKTLLVTSYFESLEFARSYIRQGLFDGIKFHFLVEFFEQEIPKDLPSNVIPVLDFADVDTFESIITNQLAPMGFENIVTDDEFSIYVAARIREKLNLPGLRPADIIHVRDKVAMKRVLKNTSLRTPTVYTVDELNVGRFNLPLVAKPRAFAASNGVQIIRTEKELHIFLKQFSSKIRSDSTYKELDEHDYQIEEFIAGDIYHLDGLVMNNKLLFFNSSRYMGTCFDYLKNEKPLGSVLITDPIEHNRWLEYTKKFLSLFSMPDGAFHLETFLSPTGKEVFLEVAARPGGALIIPTIKMSFGIDLRLEHLRTQLGIKTSHDHHALPGAGSHGWLVFPRSFQKKKSLTIHSVTLEAEKPKSLIKFKFPEIGSKANGTFSYLKNNGEFIFKAESDKQITKDILTVIDNYKVEVREKE